MSRNMGNTDRWIRGVVGVGLLLLVFTGPHTRWGWLGLLLLATAVVGICPLYAMLGWNTRGREWIRH